MIRDKGSLPRLSAALAGIPAALQTVGPWAGRRQLFVKFAVEAETATIYTFEALRGELTRLASRSRYHSVAIVGRDALAEAEFLRSAFEQPGSLPVMLDHDGQRPEALGGLIKSLTLVQVTLEGGERAPAMERVCASLAFAASEQVLHAVAIVSADTWSDGALLRIVEQIHGASPDAQIVLHPTIDATVERDRRWVLWLQQAMAVHVDVRVLPKWPSPTAR